MNEAFQDPTPEPHVHYHFKPRYQQQVTVDDNVFIDRQFGEYIRDTRPQPASIPMGKKIVGVMKEYL